MPEKTPVIEGVVYLSTTGWSGTGNVSFQVNQRGDIKNITLVREENLARWVGKGKKVINLQDVSSPYLFSYELDLDFGDNYLPVIVTDLRGNTSEYKHIIRCGPKPDNNPQINIENTINVN